MPLATAAGIAVGDTLEALSAGLLLRFLDFHKTFDRARDVFKFSLAAILCTMLAASVGTLSLCLGHTASWPDFGSLWLTWWLGDTVGALLVAPLLLTWSTEPRQWPTKRYAEAALLLTLLAVSSTAAFGGPSPIPLKFYPLARLVVPFFPLGRLPSGPTRSNSGNNHSVVVCDMGHRSGCRPFRRQNP